MNNLSYYICTLILLTIVTPYAFADDGKIIHVNIFDSYSQVTLQSNLTVDSIKQKNIVSAILDSFDFEYEDLESYMSISYGGIPDFIEKSSTIAISSNCQTEVTSNHAFVVDSIDIDSIFFEIIVNDRLTKNALSQSLLLQSNDPENWTITAVTENMETKIQMLHCNERLTDFIQSSNQDEIIFRLVAITGLDDSHILDIWNYDNRDLKEEIDFQTNEELIESGIQIMTDAAENQAKLEQTVSDVQTGDGGGCLIATAAYGTELAPQVQLLREIRDNQLLNTESGKSFMSSFNGFYYSFSPVIADLERENPLFQQTVKAFITPMISSLSIMTLVDGNSEVQVLGLGISVIALNLGLYIAAPAAVGFTIHRKIKSRQ